MDLSKLFERNSHLYEICDMAISRESFTQDCLGQFRPTLTHLCKICTFPNGNIKHWKDEIFGHISPLFGECLKNDKRGKVRKKCFDSTFVHGFFEDDFSGYDKVKSFFKYAIRDEGFDAKDFDLNKLAEDNKERIIEFFKSFLTLPCNVTPDDADEFIDEQLDKFCKD